MHRVLGRLSFQKITNSALIAFTIATVPTTFGWSSTSKRVLLSSSLTTTAVSAGSRLFATTANNNNNNNMSTDTCATGTLQVAQFPCLSDNYGYLIHDEATGQTAAIDTPEAAAYAKELQTRGWTLTHILNTHHHWDHVGGNQELKKDGVKVYGPASEKAKIPGIDVALQEGDEFEFGSTKVKILDVGGHTAGHIAYYLPDEQKIFVGDSLFAIGCGRMFEGTPTQFWGSLQKLRNLPDDTLVYCAHEYTASNAKFAMSVEPGNQDLVERVKQVNELRSRGEPTVPSLMGLEKKTNPFLRCDVSDEIRRNVGAVAGDSDADVFGKVRRAKDTF